MGKLIMFYDTETTGLWDFKADLFSDVQPNLIQLGFKVYDQNKSVIFELGHLVDTTQFPSWRGIDPGAEAVHKISEINVRLYGIDPELTARQFIDWSERCSLFVAHNDAFDTKVMQAFAKRAGFSPSFFEGKRKFCTMQTTTNICKVPHPSGRGGYKWPKLNEAYPHFHNGANFVDAHNALADVNACADIFWKMHDKDYINVEEMV